MKLNGRRHFREWFSFLLPFFVIEAAVVPTADADGSGFSRLSRPEPPHRSVFALLEDDDGFLWIGTQDGLARYDGYEMRTLRYDPNDADSLSANSVRTLVEDAEGRIWVGTESGLNLVDRHRLRARRIATPDHPDGRGAWFHCALADQNGRLWFGTDNGLLRVDADDLSVRVFRHNDDSGLAHTAVVAVQQDSDGRIWAVTSDSTEHVMHRLGPDGTVELRFLLSGRPDRPFAFLIDSRDRAWLHPSAPLDLDNHSRKVSARSPPDLCSETHAVVERADGSLWFACDDGLWEFDPAHGAVTGHPIGDDGDAWLENFGQSLLEDRSGTLWVGTEGGLYRRDPHASRFTHHRNWTDDPASLSTDAVSALAETPDGALWVATYGGGLNRLDRTTGLVERVCVDVDRPNECTSTILWHLHTSPDGTLWIAGDGLWGLDPATRTLTQHVSADTADPHVIYITSDPSGDLWIGGTSDRLYRYVVATAELETIELDTRHTNPEVTGRIDSMLLEEGQLWLGFPHALGRYDITTRTFEMLLLESTTGHDLSSLGTWTIHRASGGALRLGTSAGLMELLPDHRFRLTTTHDGLPGSAVFSIIEEPEGTFWLGTNQGLVRYRPGGAPGKGFRTFRADEGTGNTEYNRHAATTCADGTMAFGGMDGVTLFDTASIRDNPFVPPVRLTGISISNRDGTRTIEPGTVNPLTLRPEDATVAFEFAALSYTMPEMNRYAYRMEGFDSDWTEAGTHRSTRYTNLPPGRYRFQVRGSNNDGVWNEEGISLEVVVLPSLWETWWFRPMLCLGLAAAGWGVYRYRGIKRRELERLRMRIAGDLHDDLSSDLSGIAVVADIVRSSDGIGADAQAELGSIRDTSLRMADGLRDIVWYIDPDHDTLRSTVRRMRQVASTLLRGVEHSFHVELPDGDRALAVDVRRNVFLIFKEAVHNVVRHAGASKVAISIVARGGHFKLEVSDDGCGFDADSAALGHGLGSMRRRARESGGSLVVDSQPGRGTSIRLQLEMAGSRDGRRPIFDRMVRADRKEEP